MLGIDFVNVFVYRNDADNFTAQLLRLYAKGDPENRARLGIVYPEVAALYKWWCEQPEPPLADEIMAKAKEICDARGVS